MRALVAVYFTAHPRTARSRLDTMDHMTFRPFSLDKAVVFSLLFLVGLGVFAYTSYLSHMPSEELVDSVSGEAERPPRFMWKTGPDSSLNLDGLPQTAIFIEVTYSDGTVQKKLIDTVPSSCNVTDTSEKGSVEHSTTLQCYGAGLGYYFIVTRGEQAYLIQRKKFEEASPEYDPPAYVYETVEELPFRN